MPINSYQSILEKALTLLDAIIADDGQSPLSAIIRQTGFPQATGYRAVATLVERGFLVRHERGRYQPGPRLVAYATAIDPHAILARTATPFLRKIARRFGRIAHLGILEDGMVTYLVKEGASKDADFTRLGMQLEAYCSGVGKILLAHLSDDELDKYLAGGPFVRLTENTIIEPDLLRAHLLEVRRTGFALDDEEIAQELRCVAAPLYDQKGCVYAALSLSGSSDWLAGDRQVAIVRSVLDKAAASITRLLSDPDVSVRPKISAAS